MTKPASQPGGRPQILADAVVDCLWRSDNEVQVAAELLTRQLIHDRELLAAFEDHLYMAAYNLLTQHVRNDRARIMLRLVTNNEIGGGQGNSADPDIGGGQPMNADSGHGGLAAANEGLMYFPIYGGKRIKDAPADEIRTSGLFYLRQGRTMVASGRWQIMVADHLDAGQELTERLLRDLYAKVRGVDV